MSARSQRAVIAGAGDISRLHATALTTLGIEVVAVVDPDTARAAERAEPIGAQVYDDLATCLQQVSADVVHVCTPHDQHLPVVQAAAAAGVSVLVEKPLAHTLQDAQRLVEVVGSSQIAAGVVFQNRYNPPVQAMARELADGTLGPITAASATVVWSRQAAYYAAKPWAGQRRRSGGGVLINQAIHTLDLLQWMVGPVVEVSGRTEQLIPLPGVDVEDTAVFTLVHGDQRVQSTMWATNTNATNLPVTLDVVCERGQLTLRGDLTITDPDGSTRVVRQDPPAADGTPAYWGRSHQALIADFYDTLAEGNQFWISPRDALTVQHILDQVYAGS